MQTTTVGDLIKTSLKWQSYEPQTLGSLSAIVYACAGSCACVVAICRSQRTALAVVPQLSSTLVFVCFCFETGSHWPITYHIGWVGSPVSLGIFLSSSPQPWDYKQLSPCLLLPLGSEDQTQFLPLSRPWSSFAVISRRSA